MSFGRKKFLAVLSAAIMLFALESAISAYFVVGPSSISTTGTALAQLLSALVLGLAVGFSHGRKSTVFDLDLAALERDATDDERFGVYRDTVDRLGATPFKTFLTYIPFGVLALIIGALFERLVFGADPFKVTVLTLFNLAFLFVIGSFLYVVLDRVLLRHLLFFRIVRYPAELRDLRQKRKNTMIPTFMTIMALTAAFSYTVLLIASMPDLASMPPMAMLLRLSSRFVPATILYLCVIIPLVMIWTENTAILHRYVLERLDQIASSEKDLTGRILIGSVDELSAIEGRINDFTELLQKSLIEIKLAFDAFAGLEKRLETAVDKSAEDSADIGRRVEATAGLAEETDRLVEVALAAEEQMTAGVKTAVEHIEKQHEAVGSSIASMRELIAAVSSAAHSAVDVRGRVERLVKAFATGSESVKRTEESVGAVVGLSQKLREINEVIASIAARTNLLAMNAAIEAAHAGSAGAGFSVVADEIRSLAENTAKRTRESKESLGAVLEQIKKALGASEETTVAFDGIRELLGGVDAGAAEIAANMAEQDKAGVEIAAKLEETTNLASSTLRLAEELGTTTQEATSAVRSVGAESRRLRENAEAMRERNASMAASIKELESAAESTRQLGGRARDLIASFKT